ncbi:MAG: MarR family transcriptional regulator [Alphaproteobacteria bacterium]|nr:MarR family transcriptional regulator [Alphaproteobacteria bacterium]
MRPPERSFGFLLYDSARLLRRDFDRRARAIGLTRAQWSVLSHLNRYEGVNQVALADLMEIQPITLVRHLDRLEDAGWIIRAADPNDRRSRVPQLTDKARPVLERLQALAAETRELALIGIGDDERERLLDALQKIRANLSSREDAAGRTGTDGG